LILDSHVHFWDLERQDDILVLRHEPALRRSFAPSDLRPALAAAGVQQVVAMQSAPNSCETQYLMQLVKDLPWVAGVVGWVDLESITLRDTIAELRGSGPLVGVRVMLHRIDDPGWIARSSVERGLAVLAQENLALDVLMEPVHFPAVATALERQPQLRSVINHAATPPLADDAAMREWASSLAALARNAAVSCKLSGLREAGRGRATHDRLRSCVAHVMDCFGGERVLFGSNWPVCELQGSYESWFTLAASLLDEIGVPSSVRAAVFGGNAQRLYRPDHER
jgi:L-fuconolactonase